MNSYKTESPKMYKISDEVIKFIEKTIRNWSVESLAVVKIQKGFIPERCAIIITICDGDHAT